MGKKKSRASQTSKGERRNVAKWICKDMKKDSSGLSEYVNKWKAY